MRWFYYERQERRTRVYKITTKTTTKDQGLALHAVVFGYGQPDGLDIISLDISSEIYGYPDPAVVF